MSSSDNSFLWLVGRGLFTSDATFVGKIVAFRAGSDKNLPTLLVQQTGNSALEIAGGEVAGGKDILVLKPGFNATNAKKISLPLNESSRNGWNVGSIPIALNQQPGQPRNCRTCGNPARWIPEYGRWYCEKERKYL